MAGERLQHLETQMAQLEQQYVLRRAASLMQQPSTSAAGPTQGEQPLLNLQSRTGSGLLGSMTHGSLPAFHASVASDVLRSSSTTNLLINSSSSSSGPAPAKGTWELDKARALLAMEERMRKLQAPGPSQPSHLQSTIPPTQPLDVENLSPPATLAHTQQGSSFQTHSGQVLGTTSVSWRTPSDPQMSRTAHNRPLGAEHLQRANTTSALPLQRAASSLQRASSIMGMPDGVVPRTPSGGALGQGQAGGAWERGQAQALLVLERERDGLREQLGAYGGLDALHKQQMFNLHAKHAKALQDAQGDAGRKLHALSLAAAAAHASQRLLRHTGRALVVWRHEAMRTRRLRWAERVWAQRTLEPVLMAWRLVTQQARRPIPVQVLQAIQRDALQTLQLYAAGKVRLRRLGQRCMSARLRRLMHAWQLRTYTLSCKRTALQQALRHHRHSLAARAFACLLQEWRWAQGMGDVLGLKLQRVVVRAAFRAWYSACATRWRVTGLLRRKRLLCVMRAWHTYTAFARHLRQRMTSLVTGWSDHKQRYHLRMWSATAQWLANLRRCQQQLEQMTVDNLKRRVFRQLRLAVQVLLLQAWLGRRRLGSCWSGWRLHACRSQRNLRVAAGAAAARLLRLGRGALAAWMVLGASRKARLQQDNLIHMESYVAQLQGEAEEARSEMLMALASSRAYHARCDALQREAQRSLLLGHAGGLVGTRLQWEALVTPPGASTPAPRMRHCTHWLPAIQPATAAAQQDSGSGEEGSTAQQDADLSQSQGHACITRDVLVVFGGVSGDLWLTDIHTLVITQTDVGPSAAWARLVLDSQALPAGRLPATTGWSSCAAGPSSFMVVGGFDGTQEHMDLYLFQVHVHEPSRSSGTLLASSSSSSLAAPGLSARVQRLTPRTPRSPPGRTDHTVVHHAAGRCLVVFGGYASGAGGCCGDVWVFDMDACTWWQPEPKGVWPTARRSHVASVVGGHMWVYGGFDGTRHLSDMWRCDLTTWTWTQVKQLGVEVTGRRGHACEVVEGRYLLVTGGYDGQQHLADVAVMDTETGMWQLVDAQGGASGTPAPCALHTLTMAGSTCVQLGGCGALGPLPSIHLLQSPALRASQGQQQQLLQALDQLAAAAARAGELHAQLDYSEWRQQEAARHARVMEDRCSEVAQQHGQVLEDVQALKALVVQEQKQAQVARQRAEAAELAAATAERRLQRAREAGRQVAGAAGQLQEELMAADVRLDNQEALLEQSAANQAMVQQLTSERNFLHVQLAAANNEAQMMRVLLSRVGVMWEGGAALASQDAHAATNAARLERRASPTPERSPGARITSVTSVRRRTRESSDDDLAETPAAGTAVEVISTAGLVRQEELDAAQSLVAQERLRAVTAEKQLKALELEHAAIKGELSKLGRQVAKEVAAAQAAQSMADAALAQLRANSTQHAQEVEQLNARITMLQARRWEEDIQGSGAMPQGRPQAQRDPWDARHPPPPADDLLQGLRDLAPGGSFLSAPAGSFLSAPGGSFLSVLPPVQSLEPAFHPRALRQQGL